MHEPACSAGDAVERTWNHVRAGRAYMSSSCSIMFIACSISTVA